MSKSVKLVALVGCVVLAGADDAGPVTAEPKASAPGATLPPSGSTSAESPSRRRSPAGTSTSAPTVTGYRRARAR